MYRVRPKKKPSQRSSSRVKIPMKRVNAQIQITATREICDSRVFLTDLSAKGVGLFTQGPIEKGERISLVLDYPKHLFVKGKIIWCTPYTLNTKILTADNFNYRIGIQFLFDSPAEESAVQKYCEELGQMDLD